jgi:putative membrane protein
MMWYYGGGGPGWLWMSAMMLLFWGAVIVLAVWAIRSCTGQRQNANAALDVLRRRLAAGEISREEFEDTKKALGDSRKQP